MNELKYVRQDPFVNGLIKRLPEEKRDSFSDDQLLALKVALSGKKWGRHTLDFRGVFGIWNWHYYYVIIGGREKRTLTRQEIRAARAVQALFLLGFLLFATLLGLLVLYLIKSAAGIDLFPGSHLDIIPGDSSGSTWQRFKEFFK